MTTEHDERIDKLLAALKHAESTDCAPRKGCRSVALADGTAVLAYYGDGTPPRAGYEDESEEQRQRRAGEENQAPSEWDAL